MFYQGCSQGLPAAPTLPPGVMLMSRYKTLVTSHTHMYDMMSIIRLAAYPMDYTYLPVGRSTLWLDI